jgi:hypothetical protein
VHPPEPEYECRACGRRTVVPPDHAGCVWCPCGDALSMLRVSVVDVAGLAVRFAAGPSLPPGPLIYVLDGVPVVDLGGPDTETLARYIRERYAAACAPPPAVYGALTSFEFAPSEDFAEMRRFWEEARLDARLNLEVSSPAEVLAALLTGGDLPPSAEEAAVLAGLSGPPEEITRPSPRVRRLPRGRRGAEIPWSDSMEWHSGDPVL